jgi:conjugal transfer ATP-binding protein TraC
VIADLLAKVRGLKLFAADAAAEAEEQRSYAELDLTEAGARLAGWLPYSAYKADERVFINKDSLGFVLEVTPQTGANQDTADRLKGLYARMPTDATLQIHLWASPNVKPMLRDYANLRQVDADSVEQAGSYGGRPARNRNVFRTMARRRYAHLLRGGGGGGGRVTSATCSGSTSCWTSATACAAPCWQRSFRAPSWTPIASSS